MLKEMMIKGGLMVGATVVGNIIIEKLEKRALKRDIEESFEPEEEEEEDEHTFENVDRAWEKLDKLMDEFEEEANYTNPRRRRF